MNPGGGDIFASAADLSPCDVRAVGSERAGICAAAERTSRGAGRPACVFAGRERPHPGAQLTLFEVVDGWRYTTLWPANLREATRG